MNNNEVSLVDNFTLLETTCESFNISYIVSVWTILVSSNFNSAATSAGLINYFKKGSNYKCQKFSRSGHSHKIMQM